MDEAIAAWNPWWQTGEVPAALRGRRRDVTATLLDTLGMPHVLVVSGMRRTGKTTILYQIINELLGRGVRPHDILFLNLEDPAIETRPLQDLIGGPADPGRRRIVILDEVQARPGWERLILPLYERKEPIKFIVSGSSADLARGEHATLLTGRVLETTVGPLDLPEYITFRQTVRTEGPSDAKVLFDEYLAEGGLPEIGSTPAAERRGLLQQYFDQILARDVAKHGSDLQQVRRLAVYLAETFARPHSRRAILRATDIGSTETLGKHLDTLRRVFLVEVATQAMETPKPSARDAAPFKVYWNDVGLRNALVANPSMDVGRQVENCVAMAWRKKGQPLHFWRHDRTGAEVDFFVPRGDGKVDAYQVWYDRDDDGSIASIPEREWRGLDLLRESLPRSRRGRAQILTNRAKGTQDEVLVVPVVEWLTGAGE